MLITMEHEPKLKNKPMSKLNPKSRQFWIGLVGVLVMLIAAVLLYSSAIAPDTSSLEVGECLSLEGNDDCILFPTFTGESLAGAETTFPDVFSTEYVMTLIVFTRKHQEDALSWLPVMQELVDSHDGLSFYDIPLAPDLSAIERGLIMLGTKGMIDSAYHANVIMVYTENREVFLEVMGIPDFEIPQLVITNMAGEVIWRIDALYSEEQVIALREQVALLFGD
jgi:hypothetical protein